MGEFIGNSTVNSSLTTTQLRVGANSTFTMLTANATGVYANTTLVANSVGPYGKTEATLNVNSATYATSAGSATNATYATSAGSTSQALTFASDGTGAAATSTFNGGTARTISYNSIGAPKTDGTNASGTWSININGSAASATNASAATNATYATSAGTATNQSGGTVSATSASISGNLTVSSGNVTGGGIILADDGDIVDNNDGYCSMRFSNGVRVYSGNRGGSAVITLASSGTITATTFSGTATYATNAGYAASAGNADTVDSIHGTSFVRNDISSWQGGGSRRLFRNDATDNYSVQTYWTGSRWRLYGYINDSGHADTHVGYADSAGSAGSATNATYATSAGSATNATYATTAQRHGTLVESFAATNVSAIQSSTAFNYGYNSYILVFVNLQQQNNGGLSFRAYSNGGYSYAAGAYGVAIRATDGGGAGDQTNNGETGMWITPNKNWGGGATYGLSGTILCGNMSYTSGKKVFRIQLSSGGSPATSCTSYFGTTVYQGDNGRVCTGFQIIGNGNLTGGNIYCYGLNW